MHICFLSSMHPEHDKRVHYKEAVSLVQDGFEVTHICPGDGSDKMLDGVKVQTFTGKRSVFGRLSQLRSLYRMAASVGADAYHCNEIESWAIGVLLKARRKAAVIFDVHEVYSTNVSERLFPKPFRPLVEWFVRLYFRVLLPFTEKLVFAKKTVKKDFPDAPDKIVLVRNFVEVKDYSPSYDDTNANEAVTALHLGAINRVRGWPQILDAIESSPRSSWCVQVTGQFGDGSEQEFLDSVTRRGIQNRVAYTKWIPYEDVPAHTASCDIGLITFQPVHDNFINALPHKLFDYMLAGLPVIVPDFAVEVREIVEEADCGIVVDTTRPFCLAEALDLLSADPELRSRLGKNGRKAVLDTYNWENEAKNLLQMYRELVSSGKEAGSKTV